MLPSLVANSYQAQNIVLGDFGVSKQLTESQQKAMTSAAWRERGVAAQICHKRYEMHQLSLKVFIYFKHDGAQQLAKGVYMLAHSLTAPHFYSHPLQGVVWQHMFTRENGIPLSTILPVQKGEKAEGRILSFAVGILRFSLFSHV